ncbi:hypothetical protein MASR2M15_20760 [Anaerolineales bacterium]
MPIFEDEFFDVLRAIETTIYNHYLQNPELIDTQVSKVLNHLERVHKAQLRNRSLPPARLDPLEATLLTNLEQQSRLFLGQDAQISLETTITLEELIHCYKRIQKSVQQMAKNGGRQSYLEFIRRFFDQS